MCTTVPKVPWPSPASRRWWVLIHAAPLQRLTRSATGQAITTCFNVISGPRRRGSWTARTRCTWCCSTTAAARLTGMRAAQDIAVHPLRRPHEPLPGHTRIGGHAWHHLPGAIGKSSPHLLGLESRAIW